MNRNLMKKIKWIALLCVVFAAMSLNACSDSVDAYEPDIAEVDVSSSSVKSSLSVKSSSSKALYLESSQAIYPNGGFFQNDVSIYFHVPEGASFLSCTMDGSKPDSTTPKFKETVTIKKSTFIRCNSYDANNNLINEYNEFYFINEQTSMPIVAIAVTPYYFKEYISAKPCLPDPCSNAKFWEDVEYPIHVKYFPQGASSKEAAFSINAGISIVGGISRNQIKKSVSIKLKKKYQKTKINFPLFDTRPENSSFKSFNLRNNGNRFKSDYIADAMATSLLEGTGVDYQRSKQVIVFYNGEYHGIYDMREKLNEDYIENNYNIDGKTVNLVQHENKRISLTNGDLNSYTSLLSFVATHDFSNQKNNDAYDSLKKIMDIENFAKYTAAQIYFRNSDWPNNNVRAWNSPEHPWKFIIFDLDFGLDWTIPPPGFTAKTNMFQWIIQGGTESNPCYNNQKDPCFHIFFAKLIKNPDFQNLFFQQAKLLFKNNLNAKEISKKIDFMVSTIDPDEIKRDQKKFPRDAYKNKCGDGFSVDGSCLKKWAQTRDSTVQEEFNSFYKQLESKDSSTTLR